MAGAFSLMALLAIFAAIRRASSFVSSLAAVADLSEDGGVLLDRSSLLATHQALRAITIFAIGRSDHHNVSGLLEIRSVVLGERRHDSLLIERNAAPNGMLLDGNNVCDRRHRLVVPRLTARRREAAAIQSADPLRPHVLALKSPCVPSFYFPPARVPPQLRLGLFIRGKRYVEKRPKAAPARAAPMPDVRRARPLLVRL
jgi:hypothetical protein